MPPIHRTAATADRVRRLFGADAPAAVADVLASGVTKSELRAAVAAGTLRRLRHGIVSAPAGPLAPEATAGPGAPDRAALRAPHALAARAALRALADDSVVCHRSAALLLALPTYAPPPDDVWVMAPRHGRVVAGTHRLLGEVLPADRRLVDGIPCTTVARTAFDVARRRPLHESLVVLDAAAARCSGYELRSTFARLAWQRDLIGLSHAMSVADARAESPLESISRGWMIEAQLPRPELQAQVQGVDGRWYRVDFLWREHRVVGEADGWLKYRSPDDLRAEKRREDALRGRGWSVVRWTSDDLHRPEQFLTRITRALAAPPPR